QLQEDARRFDSPSLGAEALACALAAFGVLESVGWAAAHRRARDLAARLAALLEERGREVAPRADTTLVSFTSPDAEQERAHLAESGCIVRNIPRSEERRVGKECRSRG